MTRLLFTLLLLAYSLAPLAAQSQLPREVADSFVSQLLADTASLSHFLAPKELWNSSRLGIAYTGIRDKFLIQSNVDPAIRRAVNRGLLEYTVTLDSVNSHFTRLTFAVPAREYQQQFYFYESRLVSPASYFTRDWKRLESRYFRFVISNEADFNHYAAKQLDSFVDSLSRQIDIDSTRLARLQREKIIYLLCNDTEEIEAISGFGVRGTYIHAYDQIISTFNCHYHEVAHLLINYKLQNLNLYTHPFFQEGFACAVGGRGGKSQRVINHLGQFLQESKFLTYPEILNAYDFRENDPSLAYPLSGLYNLFLLETLGPEAYLNIYSKHSARVARASDRLLEEVSFPSDEKFDVFLANRNREVDITFPPFDSTRVPIIEGFWGRAWDYGDSYYFQLRGSIRATPEQVDRNFTSKEFREIFPDLIYTGQKYFLEVSAEEVKLFNFYSSTLIAFYSSGLSLSPAKIWHEDGYYAFAIRKEIFDEDISSLIFSQ